MSDPTNEDRAEWAHAAVEAFADLAYNDGIEAEELETILGDLLCDLRHWAAGHKINFTKAVEGSEYDFNYEVDEENEQ